MTFFNKIKNLFTKVEEENVSELSQKKVKLHKGLEKTKSSLFKKISRTVVGKSKIDENDLDDIEEILITSDIGIETTLKIIG
jgi:fused signal recognition particle receptor